MSFEERRFARMLSISVTIGLIGAIYGGGPVSYLKEVLGYQTTLIVFMVAGLFLAFITSKVVPNVESKKERSIFLDLKEVLQEKKVIGSCLFAGLMVGPLEGFADVWGATFLRKVYGYDLSISASLPSMMFIGMCFGGPFLSLIAEKIKSYIATIVGAGIIMALGFFSFLHWNVSVVSLAFLFILIGICCAYQILAIYQASTYERVS